MDLFTVTSRTKKIVLKEFVSLLGVVTAFGDKYFTEKKNFQILKLHLEFLGVKIIL